MMIGDWQNEREWNQRPSAMLRALARILGFTEPGCSVKLYSNELDTMEDDGCLWLTLEELDRFEEIAPKPLSEITLEGFVTPSMRLDQKAEYGRERGNWLLYYERHSENFGQPIELSPDQHELIRHLGFQIDLEDGRFVLLTDGLICDPDCAWQRDDYGYTASILSDILASPDGREGSETHPLSLACLDRMLPNISRVDPDFAIKRHLVPLAELLERVEVWKLSGHDPETFREARAQRKDSPSDGVRFLVDGLLPRGMVTLLAAGRETGKSTLAHELAVQAATDPSEHSYHWLGQLLETAAAQDDGPAVMWVGEDPDEIIRDRERRLAPTGRPGRLIVMHGGRSKADTLA